MSISVKERYIVIGIWFIVLCIFLALCNLFSSRENENKLATMIKNYEKKNNSKLIFIISDYWEHRHNKKFDQIHKNIIDIDNEITFFRFLKEHRKNNYERLDVIIHCEGGSIVSSDVIIKNFLESKSIINCYIPVLAQSAGTSVALSCSSIKMDENAYLGPIDPQINYVDEESKEDSCSSGILKTLYEEDKIESDEIMIRANEAILFHDDNINTTRDQLKNKHNYLSNKQISTILTELASGKYPHHKYFSKKMIEDLGFQINEIESDIYDIFDEFFNKVFFIK
jgi:hypothetical protein